MYAQRKGRACDVTLCMEYTARDASPTALCKKSTSMPLHRVPKGGFITTVSNIRCLRDGCDDFDPRDALFSSVCASRERFAGVGSSVSADARAACCGVGASCGCLCVCVCVCVCVYARMY